MEATASLEPKRRTVAMARRLKFKLITFIAALAILIPLTPRSAHSAEFVVYSIYRGLDLGGDAEKPQKDYYVNMGSNQGLRVGAVLDVLRRVPTYDTIQEKLYRDVTFPIARLRVIHTETTAAIARLEKILPADKTPAVTPRAVMVGDIVTPGK